MKIITHHPAMSEKDRAKKLIEIAETIIGLTEHKTAESEAYKSAERQIRPPKYRCAGAAL